MSADPTNRFSSRVADYVKYRPGYPDGVLRLLEGECGLRPESVVADVGSGTGILSELFLKNGNRVYGIEPNQGMREAGERLLAGYPNFTSVEGKAEATTLQDACADFVTAGQALHWFDLAAARREVVRVLKPGGWTVVVWNERRTAGTPFLEAYERLLLNYGTDYREVSHKYGEESVTPLFGADEVRLKTFENHQSFDFDGLKGRLMSSSYVPQPGHENHGPMLRELAALFEEHSRGGRVRVEYDTMVYYGRLSA